MRRKRTYRLRRECERQGDGKTGPSSDLAFDNDCSPVCSDNPFDNRESEPAATAPGASSGWVGAIEAFKDMRQVFWGNANPRIMDGQLRFG